MNDLLVKSIVKQKLKICHHIVSLLPNNLKESAENLGVILREVLIETEGDIMKNCKQSKETESRTRSIQVE